MKTYKISNFQLDNGTNFLLARIGKFIVNGIIIFSVIIFKSDIQCKIPFSTIFSHGAIGVVMAKPVILGEYVAVGQNVTIGTSKGKTPRIGDYVAIGPHSIIIGDVDIGHHSIIGAGAVVVRSCKPYSVVVGNPGKTIHQMKDNAEYYYYKKYRI